MCDISSITAELVIAHAAIIAAIAALGAAIALNNSFFGAPGAPVPMGIAAASSLAASIALGVALSKLDACAPPTGCEGDWHNIRNVLAALATVMAFQAIAAAAAVIPAAVPFVGAAPMYVILTTLVLKLPLVPTLIGFVATFGGCIARATATNTSPMTANPSVWVAITAGTVIAVATFYALMARNGSLRVADD